MSDADTAAAAAVAASSASAAPENVVVAKVKVADDEIPSVSTLLTLGSGENAVQVPPLGMGLWAWGEKMWGYNTYDQDLTEKAMKEAFEATLEIGVNFFDTAEVYANGESERFLGKFIAEKGDQAKIVGATKFLPRPLYVGPWGYPDVLLTHLKASLQRLNLKQIDLYQIHGPIHFFTYIETIGDALALAVKQGLVKQVGVSNYSVSEMKRMHAALAKHGIQLASNQVEFSLLHRLPEKSGLIAEAHKLGVVILAYSPLGMGRLTGKYDVKHPPPSNRKFGAVSMTAMQPLIEKLRELGTKYDRSPGQISLNWIICKGAIPIPGAKNAKQAQENARCLGFRLTAEEIASLDKLSFDGSTNIWQHG